VLGFLSRIESKSLPVQLRELSAKTNGGSVSSSSFSKPQTPNSQLDAGSPSPKQIKLLRRVVEFYQGILAKDPRGAKYLESRGIKDPNSLRDFGVGYANGSLLDALPPEGELLADLKALGIVTEKGYEFFSDCIVVPLWDLSGTVTGLYGRRITDQEPHHLYLPGPRRGLINWQAAKRSSTILLTEAILDALTLYEQGFKNVMPCYGVNGLSDDHITCFQQFGVKEVILCFDSDEAGKKGAASAANRLSEIGISCSILTLPDKDVNDYFQRHTPEEFEALVKSAHPLTPIRSEAIESRAERFFEPTEAGFRTGYGDRIYEVKGIHRQGVQLRVTLLCMRESKGAIYLDAVDLYSARARERFSQGAASMLKEREELIRDDLLRLTQRLERWGMTGTTDTPDEPSPQVQEAAKRFLSSPDLFAELLSDLDTLGLVGEETVKLIGYLACTSRKLAKPLSILIQSRSAAGKSACVEALLSLMPPEDVRRWTRLTDQALFYQSETALVHKLVAIEELAGLGGAAYSIRSMASSGMLSLASVMKDPASGQLKVREHKVQGPVGFLLTTARPQLDEEMASRFWTLSLDESMVLTEKILARQREDLTVEGYLRARRREAIIAKHQAAQRMLRSIVVLDAKAQSHPFGTQALWARRDQPKVLSLVRAIALLSQRQREARTMTMSEGEVIEYLDIQDADWKRAEPLIAYLMEFSQDQLPAPSRALLSQIERLARERSRELSQPSGEISFSRRELMAATGWSLWQLKTYLPPLVEHEYLWVRQGRKGQEYRYELPASS
jgi:DNA primase